MFYVTTPSSGFLITNLLFHFDSFIYFISHSHILPLPHISPIQFISITSYLHSTSLHTVLPHFLRHSFFFHLPFPYSLLLPAFLTMFLPPLSPLVHPLLFLSNSLLPPIYYTLPKHVCVSMFSSLFHTICTLSSPLPPNIFFHFVS